MQGTLTTLAVVVLIGACLAPPVLWVQSRLTRNRPGPAAAPSRQPEGPAAHVARTAALERDLAAARAENAALRESLGLQRRLLACYKQIIETLSPGLLAEHGAQPRRPLAQAAE